VVEVEDKRLTLQGELEARIFGVHSLGALLLVGHKGFNDDGPEDSDHRKENHRVNRHGQGEALLRCREGGEVLPRHRWQ